MPITDEAKKKMNLHTDNKSYMDQLFSPTEWDWGDWTNDSKKERGITCAKVFALAILILTVVYPLIVGIYYASKKCCSGSNHLELPPNDPLNEGPPVTPIPTNAESTTAATTSSSATELTWEVSENVQGSLDQLFRNSPYQVDTLPFYPELLPLVEVPDVNETGKSTLIYDYPKYEKMSAPVMRGRSTDGRHLIFIQLDKLSLRTGGTHEPKEKTQDHPQQPPYCREILILTSGKNEPNFFNPEHSDVNGWTQVGMPMNGPTFFFSSFTNADGSLDRFSTSSIGKMCGLLRTGTAETGGPCVGYTTWGIPGHPQRQNSPITEPTLGQSWGGGRVRPNS